MSIANSSIFNEVFGPIMVGPSSSHTAGPARIGMMCHQMLQDEPAKIEITFDKKGSFAATYQSQGSNYGFIGGILGIAISDEAIKKSLTKAEKEGIAYQFMIEDLGKGLHPNFAKIKIVTRKGQELIVEAASTGGGMFEITKYMGYEVAFRGGCHEFVFFTMEPEKDLLEAKKVLEKFEVGYLTHTAWGQEQKPTLVNLKTDRAVDNQLKKALDSVISADSSLYFGPILPVVKRMNSKEPFANASEALKYASANDIREPWRIAAEYESSLSGKTIDDVITMMMNIYTIMSESASKALAGDYAQRGFIGPQCVTMDSRLAKGDVRQVNLGVLNRATLWSSGIMDYDICQGLIVAAPTGGSSGVLPGAVVSVGNEMGKSPEDIGKALLVGGLVGVFIDHGATFAAEIAGCQAEIGAGSAMAAAAVVQLLGGTTQEAFDAAALALQNMLGLVCDPVAGVGNIPCVSRNASGAANALISANMVLAGFNPCIPLDEVIHAMLSVGEMLPPELKCTGKGGLCITPSARRIEKQLGLSMTTD